jgi:RND family efflux transporter MFP subunit
MNGTAYKRYTDPPIHFDGKTNVATPEFNTVLTIPQAPSRSGYRLLRRLTLPLLLTGFIGLSGCEEPPVAEVTVVRPVKIHTIGSLDPAAYREYPGTIRAFQHAEMGFEVSGRVTEFLVREGDWVKAEQILARLDARDYQAQLDAAEADVRKAQGDLARSRKIYKQDPGAISTDVISTDKREVDVAKARLAIASKGVEDTELRAPFDGIVARKLVEDFANVLAKKPVLIVQDKSVLEIEVNLPERDMVEGRAAETKEGVTAKVQPEITVSALPDRHFPGTIKEWATTADPVTRTFAVKLNFDNPGDVHILPGMTARVRVIIDPKRAWSVPATAAQADESGQAYVWKVDPATMTVSRVAVELGELEEDRVRLMSGVEAGDMIAVSGVAQLRDGIEVRKYQP